MDLALWCVLAIGGVALVMLLWWLQRTSRRDAAELEECHKALGYPFKRLEALNARMRADIERRRSC